MSTLGYHKAQLTKAGNALRAEMAEIDSTIMERVVLTGNPGTDIEAVYDRKRCVLFTSATIHRAVSSLKSRWEAAQEFARENPGEHGELPFLDAIQDHWDASGLDRAMEEAETSLVPLDVAVKLLPTPEAVSVSAFSLSDNQGQNFISPNAPAFEQPLKLPAFELPEFNGEIDAFPQFWDLFATAVHNNTSVPPTAQNYEDAVRILLNTYHRPEILRSRLWDKLIQQRPSADSAISQRITLCAIQAIWSQMKHVTEDASAIGTLKLIRCKFPSRTRERVGELKSKGDSLWTVDELLAALDKVIDQLEVIEDADPATDSSYNIVSSVCQGSRFPCRCSGNHRFTSARHMRNSPSPNRKITGVAAAEPLHVITVAGSIIARSVLTVRVRPEIMINLIPAVKAALPQDAQTTAVDIAIFHHASRPSSLALLIPQVQVRAHRLLQHLGVQWGHLIRGELASLAILETPCVPTRLASVPRPMNQRQIGS
ncbi:hypothetical protein Aduo_001766 [Ancylostoma duodenale]